MDATAKKEKTGKRPKPWRVPTPAIAPPRGKRKGPYESSSDNERVVLTGADRRETTPTCDPFDRAHAARDAAGFLLPAAGVTVSGRIVPTPGLRATPRRYHRSQVVGRPGREVGIDSAFDAWSLAVRELKAQGVNLSGGWDGGGMIERVLGSGRGRGRDDIRLRDILHRRTSVKDLTPEEARLERAASRLLRQ